MVLKWHEIAIVGESLTILKFGVTDYAAKRSNFRVWHILAFLISQMLLMGQANQVRYLNDGKESKSTYSCMERVPSCSLMNTSSRSSAESVCGIGCCSDAFEAELHNRSQSRFFQTLINLMDSNLDLFNSSKARFSDYFTKMLDQSTTDLHNMFVKAYGLLYQQNSDVFMDLFSNLHQYFEGLRHLNLAEVLDDFFSVLLQRIFVLLNAQHSFDEHYLTCVSDNMKKINPFGDVPTALLQLIKRPFIAARSFVQGLTFAENVFGAVSKVKMVDSCMNRITRMLHCSLCSGFPCVRPCMEYCTTVMSNCLNPLYSDLSESWIGYIDELLSLAGRLEGPFNIENVVDPIEVMISEAIMNFQTNYDMLSMQIFSICGQPVSITERKRRSANVTQSSYLRKKDKNKKILSTEHQSLQLSVLMQSMKPLIQNTKFFWKGLFNISCHKLAAGPEDVSCWNGSDLVSRKESVPVFLDENLVPGVDFASATAINKQVTQLRALTARLKMAVSGMDVDWIGNKADVSDGSGDDYYDLEGSGWPHTTNTMSYDSIYPNLFTIALEDRSASYQHNQQLSVSHQCHPLPALLLFLISGCICRHMYSYMSYFITLNSIHC